MMDVTEQSTHLSNSKKSGDEWLDDLLSDWGSEQNSLLKELGVPVKSTLSDMADSAPPKNTRCKTWRKNDKTTQSRQGSTPNYMPHHRIDRVNRIISVLESTNRQQWQIIVWKYREQLTYQEILDIKHIRKDAYCYRLKLAKAYIKRKLKYGE